MDPKDIVKNRGLLAIIIGVAVFATAGLSVVYASTSSDPTQSQQPPQIQGSINLQQTLMSNVKIPFSTAEQTAASAVTNGKIIGGYLTIIQGSVVYSFKVTDDKNLVYSVIVDAGDGKVLYTSQGQTMNFGSFGMGCHRGYGSHMHGNAWNTQQAPSGNTNPSSSDTNPTSDNTGLST
ncbi:MAG TPA: PepSY domain-containing protein [Nitrosopumilaceae archaeon]|nr:PepSY domain-containing protein [Nitrosopumilaceae archaeon]